MVIEKKKFMVKIVSRLFALVVMMACFLVPTTVFADDVTTSYVLGSDGNIINDSGSNYQTSVQDSIDLASENNGSTIYLNPLYATDLSAGSITFSHSNTVTLDLNGYALTSDSTTLTMSGSGTLILKDTSDDLSGSISTTGTTSNYAISITGSGSIAIYGGTYGTINGDTTGNLTIYGGTFSKDMTSYMPSEGYSYIQDETAGTWTIGKEVAQINSGTKYISVQTAIDAATNGSTIALLSDVAESVEFDHTSGTEITLDLKGYELSTTVTKTNTSSTGVDYDSISATLTMSDTGELVITDSTSNGGTIAFTMGGLGYMQPAVAVTKGTVTISDVTLDGGTRYGMTVSGGEVEISNSTVTGSSCGLWVQGGTVTINSGEFTTTQGNGLLNGTISGTSGGTVTINGGTFTSTGSYAVDNSTGSMTISGGIFKGYTTSNSSNDALYCNDSNDATLSVSGGTYSSQVDDSYLATGYVCTESGTMWIVALPNTDYVAYLWSNSIEYLTIAEAVAAAEDIDTITILLDCSADNVAVNGNNLTFDGSGVMLSGSFVLTDDAVLVFDSIGLNVLIR